MLICIWMAVRSAIHLLAAAGELLQPLPATFGQEAGYRAFGGLVPCSWVAWQCTESVLTRPATSTPFCGWMDIPSMSFFELKRVLSSPNEQLLRYITNSPSALTQNRTSGSLHLCRDSNPQPLDCKPSSGASSSTSPLTQCQSIFFSFGLYFPPGSVHPPRWPASGPQTCGFYLSGQ